ncbi:haloacid dehalogenase type II [Solicola gregarius]|uniref:Haloacid dehalogenase type II n=1 Tax=Solicola gregarius TaxID=2908642 RepID=A0AA46TH58_9ACTN|nr:haloacid dehalogenase type II [Solicola gregarius]UYM05103.1 haloacid dehalogenase type II [Solicola gregarius]
MTSSRTAPIDAIDVAVFDVLGTMVDEPGGLRTALREAVPGSDDSAVEELLTEWQKHVEEQQDDIASGRRSYVSTDVVDREAAVRAADRAGVRDPAVIERLATAPRRLPAWPDAAAALARFGQHLPVVALSNASHAALLRLNAYADLRWHLALSAEAAEAYKPAASVYQLAFVAAATPPERTLMVAAHASDLRGAQAAGMRTAYVERPVGDPLRASDDFDWQVGSIDELIDSLTTG